MAERGQKTYSLLQASAILGVHRNTLGGWIEAGCPVIKRADRSRGIEWQISIAQVVEWRISRAVEDALSGYQDESGKITKDEADRRRAIALAITAEVAADEALNVVVRRQDAEADAAEFCSALRTGLSNAGAKIAARAAGISSAPEIQEMYEGEINRAFDAVYGHLDAKWSEEDVESDGCGED